MAEDQRDAKDRLQAEFTASVHRHHHDLCSRGMNPNEACALALRAAAGQVIMPRPLSDIQEALRAAKQSQQYGPVADMLRLFFASPDALHACFWPQPSSTPQQQQQEQQQQEPDGGGGGCSGSSSAASSSSLAPAGPAAFAGSSSSGGGGGGGNGSHNSSSSNDQQQRTQQQQQPSWLQIDHAAVQQLHDQLQACHAAAAVRDALAQGSEQLLLHIAVTAKAGGHNPGFTRQVCGLLANPWLAHLEYHDLLAGIAGVLSDLQEPLLPDPPCADSSSNGRQPRLARQLTQLLHSWGEGEMGRVVGLLQQYITLSLYRHQMLTPGTQAATRLLGLLHEANSATQHLDMAAFYNDAVNEPDFNVKEDYKRWTSASGSGVPAAQRSALFSFCAHPWVYDPASKARILALENQGQQLQAFEASVLGAFLGGPACPFLLLRVRRGPYLLSDTLLQINSAKNDNSLKKPLKVKFVGEEGVDEGGLQKEFFQLLVRQCFNPEFGMFIYSEETRLHWFHASSMDLDTEYELIGILIGLAIYNGHILEFQFPMVLYKQLLGQPVGLEDLAELHPDIHRSLVKLTAMSEEELDSLDLTFQVEVDAGFGERHTVDLLPSGSSLTRVTRVNVWDYAAKYARHLLVTSVARQFGAFQRGFLRLCSGAALQLFRPAELEQLVCGGRVVDLSALESATQYDGGYHSRSRPVRWFWEVVHALDGAQQKRLLFFITGSDRVPIKGLAHLSPPFVISRNGDDDARLPTAHTCFNHLLLPGYSSAGVLRARLLLALENAEGFGLL